MTELFPSVQTADRTRDMLGAALLRLWRYGKRCEEDGSECSRECPHGEAEMALTRAGLLPREVRQIEEEEPDVSF